MRTANRVFFAILLGICGLLIAVPLLAPKGGPAASLGILTIVVGVVLFALFWGTIIKFLRRR